MAIYNQIGRLKAILKTVSILLLLIVAAGCSKDEVYYEGKVVSLNNSNGCFDLIEISKSITGGLPVNTTITFDATQHIGQLKYGDQVSFKIIHYEKWSGFVLAICIAPQYTAQVEFANK